LLVVVLVTPVEVFVAVIFTPGITFPLGSVIVPLKVALLDWQNACTDRTREITTITITKIPFIVFILASGAMD
jgi:hypothetical protein